MPSPTQRNVMDHSNYVLVSNVSDASFAIGVAHARSQKIDISDVVGLKTFVNSEFCPRFLIDDPTEETLGHGLQGKSVYILSTSSPHYTRNELAMRNCLLASAAKENGADLVALVEPDLFYSAQDRGPRTVSHPQITDFASRVKFVGQTCSAGLYARMLKAAGVDMVMTVHNHKPSVMRQIYEETFAGELSTGKPRFVNLDIAHIVANYVLRSGLVRLWNYGEHVGFVAPDDGAVDFVRKVREYSGLHNSVLVTMKKTRHGQRDVEIDSSSDITLLKDRDVFVLDDMVRTGGTIAANVKALAENPECAPTSIFFYCTHTYICPEARENLNSPYITQFITTNTIPNVLNRDDQGRLRKKTVVLKLEPWIGHAILQCLEYGHNPDEIYDASSVGHADGFYAADISSKNPLSDRTQAGQYELMI